MNQELIEELFENRKNNKSQDNKEVEKKIYFEIAKNINDQRLKKDMSLEELSKISGVDKVHLYRIEKSERNVGMITLIKLAFALEVNINQLIGLEEIQSRFDKIFKMIKCFSDKELDELLLTINKNHKKYE